MKPARKGTDDVTRASRKHEAQRSSEPPICTRTSQWNTRIFLWCLVHIRCSQDSAPCVRAQNNMDNLFVDLTEDDVLPLPPPITNNKHQLMVDLTSDAEDEEVGRSGKRQKTLSNSFNNNNSSSSTNSSTNTTLSAQGKEEEEDAVPNPADDAKEKRMAPFRQSANKVSLPCRQHVMFC